MKKLSIISVICIYSAATMGFTLKQFYCSGRLESTTVAFAPEQKSNNGKGTESDKCCNYKYQFFKVKDNHELSPSISYPAKTFIDLHLYSPSFTDVYFISYKAITADGSNASPPYRGVPVYIFNSVFRI